MSLTRSSISPPWLWDWDLSWNQEWDAKLTESPKCSSEEIFFKHILWAKNFLRCWGHKDYKKVFKLLRLVPWCPLSGLPWTSPFSPKELICPLLFIIVPCRHLCFLAHWFTGTTECLPLAGRCHSNLGDSKHVVGSCRSWWVLWRERKQRKDTEWSG